MSLLFHVFEGNKVNFNIYFNSKRERLAADILAVDCNYYLYYLFDIYLS